ncbi:TetR/AcrR family transcriptional regulator [Herbiconiux sp. P15]|uniref:TetR/AcrR family transcriptional regulator n=1 Tax=Herbiconiux liukaitaii TaxID=3342799 RepID=UPI0035BB46A5
MTTSGERRAQGVRPSAARERLLETAAELFYREGITRVGLDRVLTEAGVPRATMYRHFAGKEALVAACLELEDTRIRLAVESATGSATVPGPGSATAPAPASGADPLDDLVVLIADDLATRHTRGCPFINAAVEYPDASSEVRQIVDRHRSWFRTVLQQALLTRRPELTEEQAAEIAKGLYLLRDGALIGGYLDGPASVRDAFLRSARAIADAPAS